MTLMQQSEGQTAFNTFAYQFCQISAKAGWTSWQEDPPPSPHPTPPPGEVACHTICTPTVEPPHLPWPPDTRRVCVCVWCPRVRCDHVTMYHCYQVAIEQLLYYRERGDTGQQDIRGRRAHRETHTCTSICMRTFCKNTAPNPLDLCPPTSRPKHTNLKHETRV